MSPAVFKTVCGQITLSVVGSIPASSVFNSAGKPLSELRVLNLITVPWFNACAEAALDTGRALRDKGAAVYFGGTQGSPVIARARAEGFEVARGLRFASFNPAVVLVSLARLMSFIKTRRINCLVSHRGEDHLFSGLARLFTRGRIAHVNVRADIRRPKKNIFNTLLHRKYTQAFVVASGFMQGYFEALGVPRERVHVIPPPVDASAFAGYQPGTDLRKDLGLGKGHVLVGVIARLDPVKGHQHIIEAANLLADTQDIKFLISGETFDVDPAQLKAALSPKAAPNVFFTDRAAEVRELLSAIDIGLVGSVGSEAVCRIALEMMAAGLPVVGTDVHSIPALIVHEKGGYIVPPADPRAMAGRLRELAADPALCEKMGKFNRERAARDFSPRGFADRISGVCQSVLPGGAGA